jgi:hydroxymethylpyrimidine/phosphomethylpyrimidine kinase
MTTRTPRVLAVGGSDSGGGAGIQADLKTLTALGVYGATAITALTAQNTLGVHGVREVEPAFVELQMRVVLDDIGADVVKTGMLASRAIVEVVARTLRSLSPRPLLVLDPVLVAKGGARLLATDAERALVEELVPLATVVTPNAPELEALVGMPVSTLAEGRAAGERLLERGAAAVLVKGGHLDSGDEVVDQLVTSGGVVEVRGPRIETRSTHGTGCTLASATAAYLARGERLEDAVRLGRAYVEAALRRAPGLGAGHGPLGHS